MLYVCVMLCCSDLACVAAGASTTPCRTMQGALRRRFGRLGYQLVIRVQAAGGDVNSTINLDSLVLMRPMVCVRVTRDP